jgi:hypothetical protein
VGLASLRFPHPPNSFPQASLPAYPPGPHTVAERKREGRREEKEERKREKRGKRERHLRLEYQRKQVVPRVVKRRPLEKKERVHMEVREGREREGGKRGKRGRERAPVCVCVAALPGWLVPGGTTTTAGTPTCNLYKHSGWLS